MLPLDSPSWSGFKTYFGQPSELPHRIRRCQQSIGTGEEETTWNALWGEFLHQGTITDAAFAVVPYVIQELGRIAPERWLTYFVELGLIEADRQRDTSPRVPADLSESYQNAVRHGRLIAVRALELELPRVEFRYLISALCSLHGHGGLGGILFKFDGMGDNCPKCGDWVYASEILESGYC